MPKRYHRAFFVALAMFCCDCNRGQHPGATLLAISVASTQTIAFADFNAGVQAAAERGEAWVNRPIDLVVRLTHTQPHEFRVITFNGEGEYPSEYNVIAITDGASDDSIRGDRYDLLLKRIGEAWTIERAETSWRCWDGRGHDNFSTTPCS